MQMPRILCSNKMNNSTNKDCLAPNRERRVLMLSKSGATSHRIYWANLAGRAQRAQACLLLPRDSAMSKQFNFSWHFTPFIFNSIRIFSLIALQCNKPQTLKWHYCELVSAVKHDQDAAGAGRRGTTGVDVE